MLEVKALVGRPKVGQRVLVRRRYRGWHPAGSEHYWEDAVVELVRVKSREAQCRRNGGGYTVTVPWSDLYEPIRGGYGGPWWKRGKK